MAEGLRPSAREGEFSIQLLLEHHRASLLANGARRAEGVDIDPYPVVKRLNAGSLTEVLQIAPAAGMAPSIAAS